MLLNINKLNEKSLINMGNINRAINIKLINIIFNVFLFEWIAVASNLIVALNIIVK